MPPFTLGLDVGATKIAAGLVTGHRVPKVVSVATPKNNRREVIAAIAKVAEIFLHPKVTAVGVGIAGAVNSARGLVYASPNFPRDFRQVHLAVALSRRLHRRVTVENDAKCFVLAEATYGAGRGRPTVVGFTLGSGIGFGAVVDGKLLRGRDGLAGEFGHTTVVEHGLRCSCGKSGHLESYASGGGMVRFYRQLTGELIDTFELERRAHAGETAARRTIDFASDVLALWLSNAIATFNPDVVVLGGGLIRLPMLWRSAVPRARRLVPYRQFGDTPIRRAKLGNNAGIIGAALVANQV